MIFWRFSRVLFLFYKVVYLFYNFKIIDGCHFYEAFINKRLRNNKKREGEEILFVVSVLF